MLGGHNITSPEQKADKTFIWFLPGIKLKHRGWDFESNGDRSVAPDPRWEFSLPFRAFLKSTDEFDRTTDAHSPVSWNPLWVLLTEEPLFNQPRVESPIGWAWLLPKHKWLGGILTQKTTRGKSLPDHWGGVQVREMSNKCHAFFATNKYLCNETF